MKTPERRPLLPRETVCRALLVRYSSLLLPTRTRARLLSFARKGFHKHCGGGDPAGQEHISGPQKKANGWRQSTIHDPRSTSPRIRTQGRAYRSDTIMICLEPQSFYKIEIGLAREFYFIYQAYLRILYPYIHRPSPTTSVTDINRQR